MRILGCQEQMNDTDTFEHQLVSNIPFLRKVAGKYIKGEENVRDLLQETIYKAIKNKHKFKTNTNLKGWLLTVLKNTFINQYHKNKYRKYFVDLDPATLEGESIQEPVLNPLSFPFKFGDKHHFTDSYNLSIKSLTYEFQILILMCDIEGYSYQQIADYLNCPVGTVRSRLYRCRKALMKTYRELLRSGKI